jgi:hypothetical protein
VAVIAGAPLPDLADLQVHKALDPRSYRQLDTTAGVVHSTPEFVKSRKINGKEINAATEGLGDRSRSLRPAYLAMEDRLIRADEKDGKKVIVPTGSLAKVENQSDWSGNYWAHYGPIKPEYPLLEGFTLYDVEVYVQQAVRRRTSLMFRNGYSFNGANARLIKYINKRINQIAYVMGITWANFMREVLTCLALCSNCFLLKLRSNVDGESGGVSNELNKNRAPIAGFAMIPPHTIFPFVDKGVIVKWRRFYNWSVKPWDDYKPEDIIHFKWDRKPGHIFGTPRLQAVRDDIFALRRLEENVELLFLNFLFPLLHVKVGTDDAPAGYLPGGLSEIHATRNLIEQMPKEGVFVTDQRVSVENTGAQGESLDPSNLIEHYKKRIFTGLGVSALDMGEGDTANRSTADNVSQALKDSIKYDLDQFADQVTMQILRELFSEANFTLSVQNAIADVKLMFKEIDMDNKIKEETHATQLYQNNGITHSEYRKRIGEKGMSDEEHQDTHFQRHVVGLAKAQGDVDIKVAKNTPRPVAGGAKKKGGKKGKSGRKTSTAKKATPTKKSTANKMRPENQHGKNNSPRKARSSAIQIGLFSHLKDSVEAAQIAGETTNWKSISARAIDNFFARLIAERGSSYTNQLRMQIDRLKSKVGQTTDPDLMFALVEKELSRDCYEGLNVNELEHSDEASRESRPEGSPGTSDRES